MLWRSWRQSLIIWKRLACAIAKVGTKQIDDKTLHSGYISSAKDLAQLVRSDRSSPLELAKGEGLSMLLITDDTMRHSVEYTI